MLWQFGRMRLIGRDLAILLLVARHGLLVHAAGFREAFLAEGLPNTSKGSWESGTVILQNGRFEFIPELTRGPAQAHYLDSVHTVSNWGQLTVTTSPKYSDMDQMFALGYAEGWLSAERIWHHLHNMWSYYDMKTELPMQWLEQQDQWVRQEAARNDTEFWRVTALILQQFDGMVAGYSDRAMAEGDPERLPVIEKKHFLFLSAIGDLGDLIPALEPVSRRNYSAMQPHVLNVELHTRGRCSALVKVTGDLSDLLMSHASWFTYSGMERIYKHYHTHLREPAHRLSRMAFSSYAGELSSDDDFYIMDTRLVLLQTTNGIFNLSLYDLLDPHSVLSWQRVRVANAIATSGPEWADVIAQYNSGTYNNQYMVIDLKKFHPGEELGSDLLWVVEQIPGTTVASDRTQTLERGYWPSYNIPFYPEVYEASGYREFRNKHAQRGGDYAAAVAGLSYQISPRAKVYRRDAGDVHSLESLKRFMRSNNWENDTYSGGSPLGQICGRGDLDPRHPVMYGCYDAKVTSYRLALALEAQAVNGPTSQGWRPFQWTQEFSPLAAHLGQPEGPFDFEFERMVARTGGQAS